MNQKTKEHLISAGVTFLSAFLLTVGAQLAEGSAVQLNSSFIVSLLLVALRAGVKAVLVK